MISEERSCYLCGRTGVLQMHHCQHGIRRKKADLYGLCVWLCPECHRQLHDHGVGDRYLQQVAQRYFEERYGHDEWMKQFGKNYI